MVNLISYRIGRILHSLLNTRSAGLYILLFAISIGAATFIENDFGTSSAQKVIYQTWWFELLLMLFGGSIIYNVVKFRMVQQKKWALLMFHLSIIIILIGAGLTRYWGFEGMMHIRENKTANSFLSRETHLNFYIEKGEQTYEFDEPVRFATLGNNHWKESYLIDNKEVTVRITDFIPNPTQTFVPHSEGNSILKMVIAGPNGREEYFLQKGQRKRIKNQVFNFDSQPIPGSINIRYENQKLQIQVPHPFQQTVMATQKKDTLSLIDQFYPLQLRALYTDGQTSVVFSEFHKKARLQLESEGPKITNESLAALQVEVETGNETKTAYIYGQKGYPGKSTLLHFGDMHISIAYGAKEMQLPFSVRLHKFEMEKYPGTNNAASYASEVQLIDERVNLKKDFRIYMNHILDYDGYRFFQSSFDRDEKGTYLSVNNDFWGTLFSYLGYGLLTLGMLWTLVSKKTRFYQITQRLGKLRAQNASLVLLFLFGFSFSQAKHAASDLKVVHADHAEKFSRIIVQDFRGRMKPIHTLSREVLRKISRRESYEGYNADQVLLSLFVDSKSWYGVPLIKLGKHPDIHKKLGVSGKYAAYRDFFSEDGKYKLSQDIKRAQSLAAIDRGVYHKELLKIDERLNILSMAFSGHLLKIIPQPNDPDHTWAAHQSHNHAGHTHDHSQSIAEKFFSAYQSELKKGIEHNDYDKANLILAELADYQYKNHPEILPSKSKVQAEISLNNSNVFNRLTGWYMLLGLGFLGFLFTSVFRPNLSLQKAYYVLFSLLCAGFVAHTLGLGLRWYVSGRAPWSNGYESMIYIAWTTSLAGLIFTRKSFGGLAATAVLAGTILFVASLSFLDPQITPLVPVLRSYWLTIHVSLEAGSYGFLMLGAIIGLINLILMTLLRASNQTYIHRTIQEMSYLSEMTLIAGLFMISIGTYLGGVWANESWGRYWGWDAKETWALVTILVYSFILHMRIIPKLFGLFSYNLMTIFGLASVIMTYYGVNYYLSGLHSYASGDPVPIPNWVFIMAMIISGIAGLAYVKKNKYPMINKR